MYGRGAFDVQSVSITANVLLFYSIGLVAFSLRTVLYQAFYSQQDTKTPVVNAAISMIINIILNIILSRYLGIGGLALATSISAIICTLLLFISLRKKIGPLGLKNIILSTLKILLASMIMGFLCKFIYEFLNGYIYSNTSLIISLGFGVLIYFLLIYIMKVQGLDDIIRLFKRKVRKV